MSECQNSSQLLRQRYTCLEVQEIKPASKAGNTEGQGIQSKALFPLGIPNFFYRPQSDRAEPSALTVHNRIVPNTSSGTVAPAETECFACTGMLGDCEWVVWMGEPPIQVDRELSSDWNNQQFLDEERKG